MKQNDFFRVANWPTATVLTGAGLILLSVLSCKKTEDIAITPASQTTTIVGTWVLADATVTMDSKTYSFTKEMVQKSSYFSTDDISFLSDGKYTQGGKSGSYKSSSSQLTLDTKPLEVFTFNNTGLSFGNGFPYTKGTTAENDAIGLDAIFLSQKLLDNVSMAYSPSTTKTIRYQLNYRKK